MKSLITAIITSLLLSFSIFAENTRNVGIVNNSVPKIVLEKDNFFAITSSFNQKLLDDFSEKLLTHNSKKLYIYFDTPGGSVLALSRMVRLMEGSSIEFVCIASFAASAGFMLYQFCDKRYMVSDGIIMSHNWAGGFADEAPRIITLFEAIQSLVDPMEEKAVQNMNVDMKEYKRLINNNLWMPYNLAKKYDAIQEQAHITCEKSLVKKRIKLKPTYSIFRSRFGSSGLYKSGCPLIQKVYTKKNINNDDVYFEAGTNLFELAQDEYKYFIKKRKEKVFADWIYLGKRNYLGL